MDPHFVQNLRYKLQKRVARLNSVEPGTFRFTLAQFLRFLEKQPTFLGILDDLLARFPESQHQVDDVFDGTALFGDTEEEAAAIGCRVLRRAADLDADMTPLARAYRGVGYPSSDGEGVDVLREVFLQPFYEYVNEQLDDQRAMLALLVRYKHRSEWFRRDTLWQLSQTGCRVEWQLAMDLYAYLYDQGIDFTIEPLSITGEIDLIAAQGTDDPVLLDVKIFDGGGRGKAYVRKAFRQIYTYTQQYSEPFGYLVIYKTTEQDLSLSLPLRSHIPAVAYNHKTVFLLTIDIFQYAQPVSQRGPLKAVEITQEDLVAILEENNGMDPHGAAAGE